MTCDAIQTLGLTTKHPFELVIAESPGLGGRYYFAGGPYPSAPWQCPEFIAEKDWPLERFTHAPCPARDVPNPTADCNLGLNACNGDLLVYTGNDVFVRDGWLEALLEAYALAHPSPAFRRGDIRPGAATLASADLAHTGLGRLHGQPVCMEGWYGPFFMFPQPYRFDAQTFPGPFADSDLILRLYKDGGRMVRNNRVVIQHLNQQTMPRDPEAFQRARLAFAQKHDGCALWPYRACLEGVIW